MEGFLPPDQHYLRLAKKAVSSSAVLLNSDGLVLLVKPNYYEWWVFPGGSNEFAESPEQACIREVREETGIEVRGALRLLMADYRLNDDREYLNLIYFAGVLSQVQISQIRLQREELDSYDFFSWDRARVLFNNYAEKRITPILGSLKNWGLTSSSI